MWGLVRFLAKKENLLHAFFSEKWNNSRKNYFTYDKEFYAIIRALDHWQHYLLFKEFIIYSDHEALKYVHTQHKLNNQHVKWVELLQAFTFLIKHKAGTLNRVADALSHRHSLVSTIQVKVIGLDMIKGHYEDDPDFGKIWKDC